MMAVDRMNLPSLGVVRAGVAPVLPSPDVLYVDVQLRRRRVLLHVQCSVLEDIKQRFISRHLVALMKVGVGGVLQVCTCCQGRH
jgi:hypothetical protein